MSCPASRCVLGVALPAEAAQTNVAVAANFTDAANEIAQAFKAKTGHEAVFSFGSTGQLYTQITQGAPFEVFLAADDEHPAKAVDEGFAVPGSQFTYAIGKLVLWSKDPAFVQGAATLKTGDFAEIAIANPEAAPYGAAAVQTMKALGVIRSARAQDRPGQQYHPGLPVRADRQRGDRLRRAVAGGERQRRVALGSGPDLYDPIKQDAVLLTKGPNSEAAGAFLEFLQSPEAEAIIAPVRLRTGGIQLSAAL